MNAIAQEVFFSRHESEDFGQDAEGQLITRFDWDNGAAWYYMNPSPRPCFTMRLLQDIRNFQESMVDLMSGTREGASLNYLVLASKIPGVFNLGGDLNHFRTSILEKNREGLFRYAKACIDVLYPNAVSLGLPITTISLVQGDALGGGFEAALSSNVLIAERSAKMGLPEILFNLFPGMGAYSLLARRLDPARAERMILSGRMYGAEELYEMGVVDVLAEDGEGEEAVYQFIRKHSRSRNAHQAIQKVRQRFNPITREELMDITTIWVDAALRLEAKDLRVMERLVRAQVKLVETQPTHVVGTRMA